jgi:hypothetical protein
MKLAELDLVHALIEPEIMPGLGMACWDLLVRQARAAGLLGKVGALALDRGLAPRLPVPVWHALEAGLAFADRQALAVHHELKLLDQALAGLGIPVLILKGAAYVAAGDAAGAGRLMSDIDILVPKSSLGQVEAALMLAGWVSTLRDPYDQRYYRRWMHELPPMTHIRRGTSLDVHHNLLPETGRIRTRPDKVIENSLPLPGLHCLRVPSQQDLILHSATHLMHEGEWDHGLRDLSDLYTLISSQMDEEGFGSALAERARQLNLERPLFYALIHLQRVFGLNAPGACVAEPGSLIRTLMNSLLEQGFGSFHASCRSPLTPFAEFCLFVRSHWLRMPAHLLIPHLLYKAFKKEKVKVEETTEA